MEDQELKVEKRMQRNGDIALNNELYLYYLDHFIAVFMDFTSGKRYFIYYN